MGLFFFLTHEGRRITLNDNMASTSKTCTCILQNLHFFNEGGSHKLLHIHVMTNYKKAVNSLPVVSLICAHFSPSGKGNLPLYSLCCSG